MTTKKPLQLDYLTFRLDVLSGLAKRQASDVYQTQCGVSLRDLRVLRFVALEPGMTQGQLVEASYLEKTVVSKLVTSLVRRGHLQRCIGAVDARHVNLSLTPEGRAVVTRSNKLGRRMEKALWAVLTPQERTALESSIEKLTTWAETTRLDKVAG